MEVLEGKVTDFQTYNHAFHENQITVYFKRIPISDDDVIWRTMNPFLVRILVENPKVRGKGW